MSFNFNLTLDIPKNIKEMSLKDLVAWLEKEDRVKSVKGFNPLQVANILNNIFMKMDLKLDNEQLVFLLDDSIRLLCEASAGSGKTTVSQLKMVKYKLLYGIDGSDILTIAYNDHAADDMQRRHTSLIESIMSQRIDGVKLNDRIVCRTFHSNALAWITEYATKCGITNKETIVISDHTANKLMQKALESVFKKLYTGEDGNLTKQIEPHMVPAMLDYLSYAEEKMLSVEDSVGLPKFMDIKLEKEVVSEVINRFNKLCVFNSTYTFSKILVLFYELLKNNQDVRERVQKAYKVLLVDEYQDMSPLMNEIISLMICDDTIFNAIGDGDQSIYSFKGTDSLNCLKFKDYFPKGKVISMGANRRCRKNIVDTAKKILSINTLRYPKELYSVKDGGSVTTIPYDDNVSEYNLIINELKNVPTDELFDICIAYRNKDSSLLLTKMLLDARIPFTVKSGYEPYKDILSSSLYDIFAMLKQPSSKAYQLDTLYKLTPASKAQVRELINKQTADGDMIHYLDYNWDSLGTVSNSIMRCLTQIKECEDAVRSNASMGNYFNKIFNLFKMYYWNWVKDQMKFPQDLEDSIINDYTTNLSYAKFREQYHEKIEIRDRFASSGIGVRLTTFHGLKGLEFTKAYLVDLDNDIFPNYKKIEKDCNGNMDAEMAEKEECTRLFYVACTRPKDDLVVLYNKSNPSIYIDLLRQDDSKVLTQKVEEVAEESLDIDNMFDDMFKDSEKMEVDFDNIDLFEEMSMNSDSSDIEDMTTSEDTHDILLEDFEIPLSIPDDEEEISIDVEGLQLAELEPLELNDIQTRDEGQDLTDMLKQMEEVKSVVEVKEDKTLSKTRGGLKGTLGIFDLLSD